MLPRDGVETEPLRPMLGRSPESERERSAALRWLVDLAAVRRATGRDLSAPLATHPRRWRRPECHRRAPRAPPAQSPPAPRSGQLQRRPPGRRRPASSRRPGRGTGRGRRVASDRRHRAAFASSRSLPHDQQQPVVRQALRRPRVEQHPHPRARHEPAGADGNERGLAHTEPLTRRSLESPGRSAPDRLRGRSRARPTASRRIARSAGDEMPGTTSHAHRRVGTRTSRLRSAHVGRYGTVAARPQLPRRPTGHGSARRPDSRRPSPTSGGGRRERSGCPGRPPHAPRRGFARRKSSRRLTVEAASSHDDGHRRIGVRRRAVNDRPGLDVGRPQQRLVKGAEVAIQAAGAVREPAHADLDDRDAAPGRQGIVGGRRRHHFQPFASRSSS